jgi:rod shape-determining protein MreB and related proteins
MPLRPTLYVQVFANRFLVRNVDTGASVEVARNMALSSPRMLIADFTAAEQQLREAVRAVGKGFLRAEMLMHPMELIEGGLTQVERRTFIELGIGAGASKVAVWSGAALSGDAVKSKIREYRH